MVNLLSLKVMLEIGKVSDKDRSFSQTPALPRSSTNPMSRPASDQKYIQGRNSFAMSTYLYIQNRNPFAINKSVVLGIPLQRSTSNTQTLNPEKYIQSRNPFAMSIYLYIQNHNPFAINKIVVYTNGEDTHLTSPPAATASPRHSTDPESLAAYPAPILSPPRRPR